jgi:hypothetical protein
MFWNIVVTNEESKVALNLDVCDEVDVTNTQNKGKNSVCIIWFNTVC